MDEFKKIELRLSELRTEINASYQVEAPTPEQLEARSALQKEYTETEKRYQEHLRGQITEEEKKENEQKPEVREVRRMESELQLSRFLQRIIEGRHEMDGVENEYQKLMGMSGMQVPLEAFAPRNVNRRPEARADASTTIGANANVPVQGHPILGRIFAYSDTEFLGVTQVMAGVGEQTFPVMTGGVTPSYVAPGAAKDAEAGTFTFEQLPPLALSARYRFRREDLARLPMYEEALRRDLSMAMADEMDDKVVNSSANPVGFRPHSQGTRIGTITAISSLTVTLFLNACHDFPDGKVSQSVGEVNIMMAQAINKQINSSLDGADRPFFMSELLAGFRGYKVSGHLPETTVSSKTREAMMAIARGQWTPGSAVLVAWPSVEMIYDPYTAAANREVSITASTLWNFKILRADPWKMYYVQTQA